MHWEKLGVKRPNILHGYDMQTRGAGDQIPDLQIGIRSILTPEPQLPQVTTVAVNIFISL